MHLCNTLWVIFALAAWPTWVGAAVVDGRPAADILAEIEAIQPARPAAGVRSDPAALKEFLEREGERRGRRDDLIWELYRAHPGHPQVPRLLSVRWMHHFNGNDPESADRAMAEIEAVLADREGTELATSVAFLRAEAVLRRDARKPGPEFVRSALLAIDEAIRRAPEDERGAMLLLALIQRARDVSDRERIELEDRLLRDYPEGPHAGRIRNTRRAREAVGKPIGLEFTDAIRGTPVSLEALRGQVVVIEFWATWCVPCVEEMPRLKDLYRRYHGRGVEFLGVCCDREDEGSLERLKAFVAKHEIPWPQYFEGDGPERFSERWGVQTIPTAFVVDREGRLATIDGRGKLETILPELLEPGGPKPEQ